MIVLFTDFGLRDPYVGQIRAFLARAAPGIPVIDLLHAVPDYNVRAAAYLLPAYVDEFPSGSVFLCVVDPGVGGPRKPVMVKLNERWFVGPDNGLFSILVRRATRADCYEIRWRPERLSVSFHGRDLFAPVAAMLAQGRLPEHVEHGLTIPSGDEWPDDLPQIIYIDHYGNAVTGIRASQLREEQQLSVKGHSIPWARTFGDVTPRQVFWYANANGLAEIAMNQGNMADVLGLDVGTKILVMDNPGKII